MVTRCQQGWCVPFHTGCWCATGGCELPAVAEGPPAVELEGLPPSSSASLRAIHASARR